MDDALRELVARALAEDIGAGDITSSAVVPAGATARARLVQKQPGVLFGLDAAEEAFRQAGAEASERAAPEGKWRDEAPAEVAAVSGPARALLAAERTALNLLCHLSGIATLTARYVRAVEGTGVEVLDTRKTNPGLRAVEKAAVAAGGGRNHRMGLYDAILIKENHAALAGGVAAAIRAARAAEPEREVEVECRNAPEVAEALEAGAERVLLDNMTAAELRAAIAARDQAADAGGRRASLEASGGITLDNIREVAETGVDFISVGALTHSAPALDISMLLDNAQPVSTSSSNIEAVRPIYDAWGAGDWSAGPAMYGPGMVWSWSDEFPDIAGVYHRPEDANKALRSWLSGWERWRCEAEDFLAEGNKVVVFTRYRGGSRDGMELETAAAHVWTMRDGIGSRLDVYLDRGRALRAAGLDSSD